MAEHRIVDRDEVVPTEIEHRCEETFNGEELEQKYSYIVYYFNCNGAYFWARTYIDEIDTVSVYGPLRVDAPRVESGALSTKGCFPISGGVLEESKRWGVTGMWTWHR